MKITPFYVGQKLVCVAPAWGCWRSHITHASVRGPRKGTVVTCDGFDETGCVLLKEYQLNPAEGFECIHFRPVQEQKLALVTYSKVLEEVPVGAN